MGNRYFALLLFAFLLILGCSPNHSNNGTPDVLRFAVSVNDEDPAEARFRMAGIKNYLEKELGIKVEIHELTGYATIIEAFKSKKLEISSLGSFSYVIASETSNVEVIACRGTLNGRVEPYHSVIFTTPATNIRSLIDLAQNAGRLSLAYGDPASTSGHLIPRDYLESLELTNDMFRKTFFTSSHSATFFTVRSGKTDVGCMSGSALNKLMKEGKVKKEEFVVLWKSPPIINSAIAIRKDLDPAFKRKVQQVLTEFRFKDTANWKKYAQLMAKQTILPYDSLCLIVAHDSMYNDLRRISKRYNMLRAD
ncbi:MAG: phosphate/phosphite/phosphonate ABC transporter substrate-binding protein [Bacteroidetes bacterium]|nr:phosphate/phosphite/phosphonate ABC transporter substrate-binding protein [Bacteroidales bacterium]NJO69754.1 phosphate/phosphite/phosphonate ABC transporter substrate-binding protein [Bacteroidota bacterium]